MYGFYIVLLINWSWVIISWDDPYLQKLSEYLPSMKLDGYSFELRQERVDKCHTQGYLPPFRLSTRLDTIDK